MPAITPAVAGKVTRPTILEYANVLVALDDIIANYASSDPDDYNANKARSLITLINLLSEMQTMGLMGSPILWNLSYALTNDPNTLNLLQVAGQCLGDTVLAEAMTLFVFPSYNSLSNPTPTGPTTTLVANALNANHWVDPTTTPPTNVAIQDSLSDYCFYELYRHADATIVSSMGPLANRIEVSRQFLAALNSVYVGTTWNPGGNYIALDGTLQDYTDTTGQVYPWYTEFNSANIETQMTTGITNLQVMLNAGLLPVGSIENTTATYLITTYTADFENGGYASCATSDGASRMWSDTQFKLNLQNGVDGTSRLNETSQLELSRLLATYDFFVRTSTNLVSRDGQMTREIAGHIKDA